MRIFMMRVKLSKGGSEWKVQHGSSGTHAAWNLLITEQNKNSHGITRFYVISYLSFGYVSELYFGRFVKLNLGLWCL